jgi:F0F1-type ATP synthase membrane subunit b/b'
MVVQDVRVVHPTDLPAQVAALAMVVAVVAVVAIPPRLSAVLSRKKMIQSRRKKPSS